jgi:energy-coupling factor transporter ATP-binding protein EcfA2
MIIIGLIGAKGSGKSTFAAMAKEAFPSVYVGALADKLKLVCSKITGIYLDDFSDPTRKERFIGRALSLGEEDVASALDSFGIVPVVDNVKPHIDARFYTPRQIAQYVGTEILRSQDADIHCKGLMSIVPAGTVLIVTDIRFPNELKFFYEGQDKFVPVYIHNSSAEKRAMSDTHESERHIANMTQKVASNNVVFNNGSMEQLKEQMLAILRPLMVKEIGPC